MATFFLSLDIALVFTLLTFYISFCQSDFFVQLFILLILAGKSLLFIEENIRAHFNRSAGRVWENKE